MHPRQAHLLESTSALVEKLAAKKPVALGTPILWHYVCPDTNKDFYLTERKMSLRSPYTGKSFTAHPEKMTVPAVGKELREEAPAAAPAPDAGPKVSTPRRRRSFWEV